MLKKLTVFVVLLSFLLVAVPVSADCYDSHSEKCKVSQKIQPIKTQPVKVEPVIYKSAIKVTQNGGVYKVGFAEITFPKNFISSRDLPITFQVEISAVNGAAGIEFKPDIPNFNKDVTIKVDAYKGYLYDKVLKKNIYVQIKKQQLKVSHFSRYALS